jgi:predicted ester cyclase
MSLDANKSVVRAFVAAWNEKDFDRFNDLMDEAATLTVGGSTISCSPAATRAIAEHWASGFPDYHFDLIHLVAEGDMVAALMPFSGTQRGPVLDLPATGRAVRVSEMVFSAFETARSSRRGRSGTSTGCADNLADAPAPELPIVMRYATIPQ